MIIHLTGPDAYRSAKRLAELRAAFIAKHDPRALNVVALDGGTMTAAEARNAVSASGFFSAKRFVSIDRYEANGLVKPEAVAELCAPFVDAKSDVIIVIREATAASSSRPAKGKTKTAKGTGTLTIPGAKVEKFAALSSAEVMSWIRQQAKGLSASIEPTAAQRLVMLCGQDTWRIATELEKLALHAGGQPITVQSVDEMVRGEAASDIFALTDALGQGRRAQALQLIRQELTAGTSPFGLIATLAGHVRNLYSVKRAREAGLSPAAIASALALHPFVVQKASAQSNRFTLDQLRGLHHQLLGIDHDLKTSPLDAETLLDLVVIRV